MVSVRVFPREVSVKVDVIELGLKGAYRTQQNWTQLIWFSFWRSDQ